MRSESCTWSHLIDNNDTDNNNNNTYTMSTAVVVVSRLSLGTKNSYNNNGHNNSAVGHKHGVTIISGGCFLRQQSQRQWSWSWALYSDQPLQPTKQYTRNCHTIELLRVRGKTSIFTDHALIINVVVAGGGVGVVTIVVVVVRLLCQRVVVGVGSKN